MTDFGISNTLVSMNLQCEAELSETNLALSQTLQMFCTEAFKPSMLIGASAANLCGSLFGFKAFSLCSKLFGSSAFATKAFSFGAKVVAEGTMFHIAPELLATRSLQTANLFRGSASSTLMVAFSQAAGKFGGGFLVQQMIQDVAVLGSQDLSGYLGWSEIQTGGVYTRLLYAQMSSCQMQVGAGVVHMTCHEITLMNAKIALDQTFQKVPTRSSNLSQGWLQSARNFFATPHAEAVTPEGIQLHLSESSQQPWRQKGFYSLEMATLNAESRDAVSNGVPRLYEARKVVDKARQTPIDRQVTREIEKALKKRESIAARIWKNNVGAKIHDDLFRDWEAIRKSLESRPAFTSHLELVDSMEGLLVRLKSERIDLIDPVQRKEVTRILESRLGQLLIASARQAIGEPPIPSEQLLMQELEAAFCNTDPQKISQDQLVKLLVENQTLSKMEIASLIQEEKIREETRRSIYLLPGHGSGLVDSLEQAAQDQAIQMQLAATGLLKGPTSKWTSARMISRFLVSSTMVLSAIGVIDVITRKHFHLYDRFSPIVARYVMEPTGWLPIFPPEAVRTIEEFRIRAFREKRPKMIIAKHASLLDIAVLTAIFSEGRFLAKEELKWVPPVASIIYAGGHFLVNRGNPKKAIKQMREAGERMKKDGIAMILFPEGTRSEMLRDEIKKGFAHTMADINAIGLVVTHNGLGRIQPAERGLLDGAGINQLIPFRVGELDPELLSGKGKKEKIDRIHQEGSWMIEEDFIATFKDLQRLAEQGNQMAAIQLAELMNPPREARRLVDEGKIEEVAQLAKRHKTSVKRLLWIHSSVDGENSPS